MNLHDLLKNKIHAVQQTLEECVNTHFIDIAKISTIGMSISFN